MFSSQVKVRVKRACMLVCMPIVHMGNVLSCKHAYGQPKPYKGALQR
jgi:hypothetical protein